MSLYLRGGVGQNCERIFRVRLIAAIFLSEGLLRYTNIVHLFIYLALLVKLVERCAWSPWVRRYI